MGEWAGSSTARRELSGWSVKKAKAKKKRIEGVEWRGEGTTGRKGQEDEKMIRSGHVRHREETLLTSSKTSFTGSDDNEQIYPPPLIT